MNQEEKTITKEQVEKYILYAMEDVLRDYLKYNPGGDYLDMNIFVNSNSVVFHANDTEEDRLSFTIEIGRDEL